MFKRSVSTNGEWFSTANVCAATERHCSIVCVSAVVLSVDAAQPDTGVDGHGSGSSWVKHPQGGLLLCQHCTRWQGEHDMRILQAVGAA